MFLQHLTLSNFRNYKELSIDFPKEGALFEGANGSGKTNILEAIHLLCTGRSQRNASKKEMVHFDALTASVEGAFDTADPAHQKKSFFGFDRDNETVMKCDDRTITSYAEWFGTQPIISFSSGDIQILYGNPVHRRRFLDMLISQVDREYLAALIDYRKNLNLRNSLLKGPFDPILCGIYEEKMAESGATITEKRAAGIAEIGPECSRIYREISASNDEISVRYDPAFRHDFSSKKSWKEVFSDMLFQRRKRDLETGFSSIGPHRDELSFFAFAKPAKEFASQGQCRSLVISLKLSAMTWLERFVRDDKIVLFDDGASELDAGRTGRTYALVEKRGQIFIASPAERLPLAGGARRIRVLGGGTVAAA
jgi:DNA replication and repair protein RecF